MATFGNVFVKKCVPPHLHFDRAEWMLDRLAPYAHRAGVPIEPRLHYLNHLLVLPSQDYSVRCRSEADIASWLYGSGVPDSEVYGRNVNDQRGRNADALL